MTRKIVRRKQGSLWYIDIGGYDAKAGVARCNPFIKKQRLHTLQEHLKLLVMSVNYLLCNISSSSPFPLA
jgi:hypothetical protein